MTTSLELTTRMDALDDDDKEIAQAITSDLLSAIENKGCAVIMVDIDNNGRAATAYVGERDAAYMLLTAAKEAYDTMFYKVPEGVQIQ